jgi:hypothetical protein
MLPRIHQLVVWKYPDDVPVEKLYRDYRIAAGLQYVAAGAGALMASTGAEFLVSSPGWMRTVSMVIMLCACFVGLLTAIPAVVAILWSSDIEKILATRDLPLPDGGRTRDRLPWLVFKMVFWFATTVLIAHMIASHRTSAT